jgi:hypothetical protein
MKPTRSGAKELRYLPHGEDDDGLFIVGIRKKKVQRMLFLNSLFLSRRIKLRVEGRLSTPR